MKTGVSLHSAKLQTETLLMHLNTMHVQLNKKKEGAIGGNKATLFDTVR